MKALRFTALSLPGLIIIGILFSVTPATLPQAAALLDEAPVMEATTTPWTTWGATQYALADDGASIWIAANGSLVRWNKQQRTYRRYSAIDGLPHTRVLAVAVDAAGNRWFGGNAGLSRLDPDENWTHFDSSNSPLSRDYVDGIAIAGGNTLYLSHGLPTGSVTRLDPDGSWHWFANREAAIVADYEFLVQGHGSNPLWTVAGSEIWAGSGVFDGERWVERTIQGAEPLSLAVDSRNHVWALYSQFFVAVGEWDGSQWLLHNPLLKGSAASLVVDQDDTVWLGVEMYGYSATLHNLLTHESYDLAVAGPVAALYAGAQGLWAIGPSWLMLPERSVTVFTDAPRFEGVTDAVVAGGGTVWLHSGDSYRRTAVQTLTDSSTAALEDDVWQIQVPHQWANCDSGSVTAWERAGSDIWFASYCSRYEGLDIKIRRLHRGEWIEYLLPIQQKVTDIFAQDANHLWFGTVAPDWSTTESGHVLGLDDHGTPADTSDDTWRDIPIGPAGGKVTVAVDAKGQLWHGQNSGLYRWDGTTWQSVFGKEAVCDLVPAADGTLYAQIAPVEQTRCDVSGGRVLIVHADGTLENQVEDVIVPVSRAFETVRTASRRNSLWTVAPDGAVWISAFGRLYRFTSSSTLALEYDLPFEAASVRRLEADAFGHVWLVADAQLWRLAEHWPSGRLYLPTVLR